MCVPICSPRLSLKRLFQQKSLKKKEEKKIERDMSDIPNAMQSVDYIDVFIEILLYMCTCATVYIAATLVAHRLCKHLFLIIPCMDINRANNRSYESFLGNDRVRTHVTREK